MPGPARALHAIAIAITLLLGAALGAAGGAARAQGLLENPNFDDDASSWQPVEVFMSIAFDTADVDDEAMSGSGRVTHGPQLPSDPMGSVGQCVALGTIADLDFSGFIQIPSGQDRTGTARFRLEWHQQPACNGLTAGSVTVGGVSSPGTTDVWVLASQTEIVPPPAAQGVRVKLELQKTQQGGNLSALFDAVFLPEPRADLAAAAALAALAGLAARGPRIRLGTGRPAARSGS